MLADVGRACLVILANFLVELVVASFEEREQGRGEERERERERERVRERES